MYGDVKNRLEALPRRLNTVSRTSSIQVVKTLFLNPLHHNFNLVLMPCGRLCSLLLRRERIFPSDMCIGGMLQSGGFRYTSKNVVSRFAIGSEVKLLLLLSVLLEDHILRCST